MSVSNVEVDTVVVKRSPFRDACYHGDLEGVERLFTRQEMETVCMFCITAVDIACLRGHLSVVRWLIQHGANFGRSTRFFHSHDSVEVGLTVPCILGSSVIWGVCSVGHLEVMQFLHSTMSMRINEEINGVTLLNLAVDEGHLEIAKWLHEKGLPLKNTLHEVTYRANRKVDDKTRYDIIKWLLDEGASPLMLSSYTRKTPLHALCRYGLTDSVRLLTKRGGLLDTEYGPLFVAISSDSIPLLDFLYSSGCRVKEGEIVESFDASPEVIEWIFFHTDQETFLNAVRQFFIDMRVQFMMPFIVKYDRYCTLRRVCRAGNVHEAVSRMFSVPVDVAIIITEMMGVFPAEKMANVLSALKALFG